jgi:alpha-ribazole phosphatase
VTTSDVSASGVTTIDFLRHGLTEAEGRLLGRTDASLTETGRIAVAAQVAGRTWNMIVSSPLNRAQETAALAGLSTGIPVTTESAWREVDFGDWDGQPLASLANDARFASFQADPEANCPPNGEPFGEVRLRVEAALRALAQGQQKRVLIVAHGGTIRTALSVLLAIPLQRLWAIRLSHATRVSLRMGWTDSHGLWGELVEIVQPPEEGKT